MATIIFSPLISGARNKVGDIVFSIWKGIPYVRRRVIPANPQTDDQVAQRLTFKICVAVWQDLLVAGHFVRANWNRFAEGYALSGFNRFVSSGSKEEIGAANLATITPANPLVAKIIDLAAATGASGVITVTWTAAGLPAGSTIRLYYRLPDEEGIHYHGDAAVAAETYSMDNLTADTEFCAYAFVEDSTQTLGKDRDGESDVAVATSGA